MPADDVELRHVRTYARICTAIRTREFDRRRTLPNNRVLIRSVIDNRLERDINVYKSIRA